MLRRGPWRYGASTGPSPIWSQREHFKAEFRLILIAKLAEHGRNESSR